MSQQITQDKFLAMVSAKADVTLPLSDFHPRCMLTTPAHEIQLPRFPVIDYHNHLDAQDPKSLLEIMDACGIEHLVNITMQVGDEALRMIDRYNAANAMRFSTIGWMDWSGVDRNDFIDVSLKRFERLVEHGAVGLKFWKDLGLSVRDASGKLMQVDEERLAFLFERAGELGVPVMMHIGDPDAFFLPLDANNERYEELAAHPD